MVVMSYHHQRLVPLPDYLLHQPHDLCRSVRVQITRRLVSKDNLRIQHQGSRHAHTLLLAARHLVGTVILVLGQTHQIQHLIGLLHPLFLRYATEHQRQRHIFHCVHGSQQIKGLENKAHMLPPELYQLVLVHFLQMLSRYDNLALGGLLQSRQHVQHRRFTGTGGSHDGTKLSAVNRQIHTVQRTYLIFADPVNLIKILHLNHRFSFLRHFLSPVPAVLPRPAGRTATSSVIYDQV